MKKKISLILIGIFLLFGGILYSNNAQADTPAGEGLIKFENPIWATSTEELINNIIDFIFKIAVVLVPLVVLLGAFFLATAAGDTKKIAQGKRLIIWALVGFILILFSKGIAVIIKQLLGISGG